MVEEKKSAVQQRLDNGIYGAKKIKPDEQRKYLGTFRERVCLTISVAELHEKNWQPELAAELAKGIGNLVSVNGNLPHEMVHGYIQTAAKAGAEFTMKTDPEYRVEPASLAIVVAAKKAVFQSPVDVKKRYPQQDNNQQESNKKEDGGFFHRLFHREGR
ncbi:YueI family protein [Limosilactobacillus panis]|uniref:YueI family protein n=1 Tax=Limosilactobacillus panis TaxID=47493 RepID=UPI001C94C82F|nr:YueI family protein [Limosilactobacillus panis]QZN93616.1 YueI family protein [Limosilactobacillus panis]